MSKESFETMLTGGHPNSLGRTIEVVDLVLKNKSRLSELFDCYHSDDEVVRLRVSNAMKRIFREHREWFIDYIDKFHDLIPTLKQPSAEWTFAQLHTEMYDLLSAEQCKNAIKIVKRQLESSDDWIVIIRSLNFLELVARDDKVLRAWLLPQLNMISGDSRKSVKRTAMKALESLSSL